MRIITLPLAVIAALLAAATGLLLALLGAAAIGRRRPAPMPPAAGQPRFAVLIPAHDEAAGIGATLAALARQEYPRDRFEVVVVADNCTDATAAVAKAGGATVYERSDPEHPGKGQALAWALGRLFAERADVEAVAFVDADCAPSPNMLGAMAARLATGSEAVQVDYRVANPGESWSSGLRYAAFALVNTVRPLGRDTLGVSCGVLGTGMAFSRGLLERHPWRAFSIVEDAEYNARLVAAGERVRFAPEASVHSDMPTSLRGAETQQRRWEGGRWELVWSWTPRLLRDGVKRRDPSRLLTGLELLVPPQSLLLAANLAVTVTAAALRAPVALPLAAASLVGQVVYVLGGLAVVRAPAAAYRSLAMAPVLMVWKVGLLAGVASGRGPAAWVRTERTARPDAAGPPHGPARPAERGV